jgi:hypothetical protein
MGVIKQERHDWIVDKLFYSMLMGKRTISPEALERGENIFNSDDSEFDDVLRNIINAETYLDKGFKDVKPFYRFYKNGHERGKVEGEIDILGFRKDELIGIEVKPIGMVGLANAVETFYKNANKLIRYCKPEMFFFNGKNGLYVINEGEKMRLII